MRKEYLILGLCLIAITPLLLATNGDFINKLEIQFAELSQEHLDTNGFCFFGKKVKISDTETAQLYGQDSVDVFFGDTVKNAFCIGMQKTSNTAIFVLEDKKPIKEQVTLETINGSVKVIRPNGYAIVGLK